MIGTWHVEFCQARRLTSKHRTSDKSRYSWTAQDSGQCTVQYSTITSLLGLELTTLDQRLFKLGWRSWRAVEEVGEVHYLVERNRLDNHDHDNSVDLRNSPHVQR